MSPFLRRVILALVILHLVAALAGVITGLRLSADLPDLDSLDIANLPQVTTLVDRDGNQLFAFAEQRRIPVTLDEVSDNYLDALIATEDPRFYRHIGVDLIAVVRAVVSTIRHQRFGVEGASTITMQLARYQFLTPEKTMWRKMREAVLATQIEHLYSKDEILTYYINGIYYGHGNYGVEAASRFYFGKSAKELTLEEGAMIAGVAQRPESLTPVRHPERALRRRNHVLLQMVNEGVLTDSQMVPARQSPIELAEQRASRQLGAYFVEDVRRWIVRDFGEDALYREGLTVQTTLDPVLQRAAERAVAMGLDQFGRRHQQLPTPEPLGEGVTPESFDSPDWNAQFAVDDIVPAVVLESSSSKAMIRVDEVELELSRSSVKWTKQRRLDKLAPKNTVVPVKILSLDDEGQPKKVDLASSPVAQAALVAMDHNTGEVLAMVGGQDYEKSEFNRATQALRQAGSSFKPFIFAAALEKGFLPTHRLYDRPIVLNDPGLPDPYQPENFERDYEGYVTIRHSLEHSRNIPTVLLLDSLGYLPAVEIAQRLGIASELRPYPSLALGSFEVKLIDLVAAYGAFANGGVLVEPKMVEYVRHSHRQDLWEPSTAATQVLDPEVASMMSSMLQGVVLHGTGVRAKALGRPVAGKTGTTDDYTDAWFVGFTPSMSVGVWVGYDIPKTLGRQETGAKAALPIWIRFLEQGLEQAPIEPFDLPTGAIEVLVDAKTGSAARREIQCQHVSMEVLPTGRAEIQPCTQEEHLRSHLPYPLQKYPINPDGSLQLPPREAAQLVTYVPDRFRLVGGGRVLAFRWAEASGFVPLAWSDREWQEYLQSLPMSAVEARMLREEREQFIAEYEPPKDVPDPPDALDAMPVELRTGRDGWPVEVVRANRSGEMHWPADPPVGTGASAGAPPP